MTEPDRRTVCWYSCGAASAVATKLHLAATSNCVVAYCDPGSEHPDNVRFRADCERWFDCEISVLRSDVYRDTWDVWERRHYLAGISGAPCTVELKISPRLVFQLPTDHHVFGYTADASDMARATKLRQNYPELTIHTPLIDRGLTKAACLAMLGSAGIEIPVLYRLGFHNNNCIPCVKATSPAYWALIRLRFPSEFERMARLSRSMDVKLTRLKGRRAFIDEIPAGYQINDPIAPACDFLCQIADMS